MSPQDTKGKVNYRPISILTMISKIFERLLDRQMLDVKTKVLHDGISAYRINYNCQSVLLHAVESWKLALDQRKKVGILLMDLSKAFDSISHPLLLAKLHAYGFAENAIKLLASYLTGRSQKVKIHSDFSDYNTLKRGVPQGSVLGPSLFNLFINDLFCFIQKTILSNFADDNTLTAIAGSIDEVKKLLKEESAIAVKWYTDNDLKVNTSKFQTMLLGSNDTTDFSVEVMGNSIEQTHSTRLLGISIDKNLAFDSHVSELCKKVATQLAVLTRFKRILDIPSKLAIVKTFIMSHFKYCSIIYHFCSCESSQKMDRIIERALRYVYSDFDSTYNDLLEKSDLASLENDRQKDIVIQTFKILHGIAPGYLNKFIGRRNIGYGTRQLYDLCLPR